MSKMIQGRIIKGIAGFYYIHTEKGIFECKAKGQFRKNQLKPMVGDFVSIRLTDEDKHLGNIEEIFPRCNFLIRPPVSNINQCFIIFGVEYPRPSFSLLNKLILHMEYAQIPIHIIFNKEDLLLEEDRKVYQNWFMNTSYEIHFHQAAHHSSENFLELLKGKTTVLAGPSGAGKSTFVNKIKRSDLMEVGEISKKLNRGRHTTRHAELIPLEEGGYIVDTPGFSTIDLPLIEKEDLQKYYPEFRDVDSCYFSNCLHLEEPNCRIREKVASGEISQARYEDYKEQLKLIDIQNRKRGY